MQRPVSFVCSIICFFAHIFIYSTSTYYLLLCAYIYDMFRKVLDLRLVSLFRCSRDSTPYSSSVRLGVMYARSAWSVTEQAWGNLGTADHCHVLFNTLHTVTCYTDTRVIPPSGGPSCLVRADRLVTVRNQGWVP